MLSQGYSNAHCVKITTGLLLRVWQVSKDTSMVALSVQTCKSSLPRFVEGTTSADVNVTETRRIAAPPLVDGSAPRSSVIANSRGVQPTIPESRLCSCQRPRRFPRLQGLIVIISMVLCRFEVVFTAGTVASGTGTKRVRGHEDIARLHNTSTRGGLSG